MQSLRKDHVDLYFLLDTDVFHMLGKETIFKTGGVAWVVAYLPSKHEALSSKPIPPKKKKKKAK
jgi:hypothetical protein